jgi:hypothetical protein
MVLNWLGENWLDVIQTLGVLFAAIEIRNNTKARRLSNLISTTSSHRALWQKAIDNPKLKTVYSPNRDLAAKPLSFEEEAHIILHILHAKVVYEALHQGMRVSKEGVAEDLQQFFSLPAVSSVWSKVKRFHDPEFVRFVSSTLS